MQMSDVERARLERRLGEAMLRHRYTVDNWDGVNGLNPARVKKINGDVCRLLFLIGNDKQWVSDLLRIVPVVAINRAKNLGLVNAVCFEPGRGELLERSDIAADWLEEHDDGQGWLF